MVRFERKIAIVIGFVFVFMLNSTIASAGWEWDGWSESKNITITNPTAIERTLEPITTTISGLTFSSVCEFRLVSDDNKSLPFQVDDYVINDYVRITFQANVSASSNIDYTLYFNNVGSTCWDFNSTDDFNPDALNDTNLNNSLVGIEARDANDGTLKIAQAHSYRNPVGSSSNLFFGAVHNTIEYIFVGSDNDDGWNTTYNGTICKSMSAVSAASENSGGWRQNYTICRNYPVIKAQLTVPSGQTYDRRFEHNAEIDAWGASNKSATGNETSWNIEYHMKQGYGWLLDEDNGYNVTFIIVNESEDVGLNRWLIGNALEIGTGKVITATSTTIWFIHGLDGANYTHAQINETTANWYTRVNNPVNVSIGLLYRRIPTISNLTEPADPSTYSSGAIYDFTVNICNDDGLGLLDSVPFEWNGNNITDNVTTTQAINSTCALFNYSMIDEAVQTSTTYKFYVNDTSGEEAVLSGTFTIQNATPSITVLCSPTCNLTDTAYGNFSYSTNNTEVLIYTILRNGTNKGSDDFANFPVGPYNHTVNTSGGKNYTEYQVERVSFIINETDGGAIQGSAEMDVNVTWTKDIELDNFFDEFVINITANGTIPSAYSQNSSVSMENDNGDTVELSLITVGGQYVIWNMSNASASTKYNLTLTYETESAKSKTWTSTIRLDWYRYYNASSNVSYTDVAATAILSTSATNFELYDNTTGTPSRVDTDPDWDWSVTTSQASFTIPSISSGTKRLYIKGLVALPITDTITTSQVTNNPTEGEIIDWRENHYICNPDVYTIEWDDHKIYIPNNAITFEWDGTEIRQNYWDVYGNYFLVDETFSAGTCENHYLDYNTPGFTQSVTYDYPDYIRVGEAPKVYVYIDVSNPIARNIAGARLKIEVRYGKDVKLYDKDVVVWENAPDDEHKYFRLKDYSLPGSEIRTYDIIYTMSTLTAGDTKKYLVFFKMPAVRVLRRAEAPEVHEGVEVKKIVVSYRNDAPIKYDSVKAFEYAPNLKVIKCTDEAGNLLECHASENTVSLELGSLDGGEEGTYIILYEPEEKAQNLDWLLRPLSGFGNAVTGLFTNIYYNLLNWFTSLFK